MLSMFQSIGRKQASIAPIGDKVHVLAKPPAANDTGRRSAASAANDPLVAALLFLAAHHGRALSRHALLAGLPITDGRLKPMLFERAARRAGLESEAVRRALTDISALVLPAVLVMRGGSTRILLKVDTAARQAQVVNPAVDPKPKMMTLADLEAAYSGYAFLVRPATAADPRATAAGDLPKPHWFWSVVQRFWVDYSQVAIAAFLVNMLALASPLFFMNVYDRVVPNGAIASLVALSIGMVLALAFDFTLRMVRSRIIDVTGKKADVVLAANIFEHVMAVKMAQRPQSVGILANQLRDFDSVREFFTSGTVVAATDLLFAFVFILFLFAIGGLLALIPLFMLPVMLFTGLALQRPLARATRKLQAEAAARHSVLIEALSGLEAIRTSCAEARMQTAWERSVAAAARSSEDVNFWSSMAVTLSYSAQQMTSLLLVIVGVLLIIDGQLTVGTLIACNMLSGRVLAPISSIAAIITRGTQTLNSFKSIDRLMALERERPPERAYVSRRIDAGRIAFENVTFKYPNGAVNALDKVSFRVGPGERVGIIGRVGSGKTTVGRLLTGFYEPQEGRVLIDGVDLRQYDPSDLRAGIGFVLQDTDLFFGKIRDNIALGKPDATDEEVLAAARMAGAEDFIASHPLGYDMPIAEGGRSLSGGQRQAIGLARVLIRKPKVLLLDEPTAHFDVRSETEFLERLKAPATLGLTIVIATHRLSVLSLVDRLLVFDRGRLIADGPRDEVLAKLRGSAGKPAQKMAMAAEERFNAAL